MSKTQEKMALSINNDVELVSGTVMNFQAKDHACLEN